MPHNHPVPDHADTPDEPDEQTSPDEPMLSTAGAMNAAAL